MQAAVEDRGIVEAIVAEHPPEPGRPMGDIGIKHQMRVVADAQPAHGRRECFCARKGKPQRARGIAEIFDQVRKPRAWNMRLLERRESALCPHVATG